MKPGYIIGGIVILLCVVVTAMALSGTVRRTVSFAEARASRQPCEIYGEVVKNSLRAGVASGRYSFRLKEEKTNDVITVVSTKTKPSNFEQATHVKAIGTFGGAEFAADDLLIKCPSKYQGVPRESQADMSGLEMGGITVAAGLAAFAIIRRVARV